MKRSMAAAGEMFSSPKFQAAKVVFYILLLVAAVSLGWLESVAFVSVLSVWALVESGVSSLMASRVEKLQKESNDTTEIQ